MQNLNEFPLHDIQQLRLKKLKKNYSWLAKQLKTNKTYICFAMTGKHPELLSDIEKFLDRYNPTNSSKLSQDQ